MPVLLCWVLAAQHSSMRHTAAISLLFILKEVSLAVLALVVAVGGGCRRCWSGILAGVGVLWVIVAFYHAASCLYG